jgi:hypothetical protein
VPIGLGLESNDGEEEGSSTMNIHSETLTDCCREPVVDEADSFGIIEPVCSRCREPRPDTHVETFVDTTTTDWTAPGVPF